MYLWIAISMGLAGSLHCIGMCGPLMMVLPYNHGTGFKPRVLRTMHHAGRLSVYALLGALFGAVGQFFSLFGFQRWLSVSSGIILLMVLLWPLLQKSEKKNRLTRLVSEKIKVTFSEALAKKGYSRVFILGVINGLLPCGLLYFALVTSLSTASVAEGAVFMLAFGLSTVPALWFSSFFFHWFKRRYSFAYTHFSKSVIVITAVLLILRGSNLGIPYISPKLDARSEEVSCCHQ